jgi:hypothetical protein
MEYVLSEKEYSTLKKEVEWLESMCGFLLHTYEPEGTKEIRVPYQRFMDFLGEHESTVLHNTTWKKDPVPPDAMRPDDLYEGGWVVRRTKKGKK